MEQLINKAKIVLFERKKSCSSCLFLIKLVMSVRLSIIVNLYEVCGGQRFFAGQRLFLYLTNRSKEMIGSKT